MANVKICNLQDKLSAAVCLTDMGSSPICHHTNSNKRESSLNISDDCSNRKAVKDGEEEFYLDDDLSSILNVTGTSVASNENIDVLARLGANYNDSIHPNVDIHTPTPFLAPRGEDGLPNDTDTATSHLLNTRLFDTTTTTKEKKKKKKKKTTKNKKKKGYVGTMGLREATADEANEMIDHGELI